MPALAVALLSVLVLLLQVVLETRDLALLQLSFVGWAKARVDKNRQKQKSNTVFRQKINGLNKIKFIKQDLFIVSVRINW